MYQLDPPLVQVWEFDGLPDAIEIDGLVFNKAIRKQPYENVIEQYRQAVPRDSMHLLVLDDGNWIVDHVDEYNPDMGHPVRHFIVDHPAGKGALIAGAGIVGLLGSALYGKTNEPKQNG